MTKEEKAKHIKKLEKLGYVKDGQVIVTKENYYDVYPNKLELHQRSPIHWYVQRWGGKRENFKWSELEGYEDHEWDGTVDPIYTAWESIANWENCAVASATSMGKTYVIALIILWFLDVFPNALVALNATTFKQLKRSVFKEIKVHIPQFKLFHPNVKVLETMEITIEREERYINELGQVAVRTDLRKLVPVTPKISDDDDVSVDASGLHAPHMLIIGDEASGMHSSILKSFQSTITGPKNVIALFGNPHHEGDQLHYFSQLPTTKAIQASGYDHPNVVLENPTFINGAVTWKSIIERREELGEKHPVYLARVRGIYPKSTANSLITLDAMRACKNIMPHTLDVHPPLIGIDVANNSKDGDLAAYAIIRRNKVIALEAFECGDAAFIADTMMFDGITVDKLIDGYRDAKVRKYPLPKVTDYEFGEEQIIVDATNVGISTINRFASLDMFVQDFYGAGKVIEELIPESGGEPLYTFPNIRSQAFYLLKMDIDNQAISFDLPEETFMKLFKELNVMRADLNSVGNKFKLESKRNIQKRLGHSPNLADAVMMANLLRRMHLEDLLYGGLGVYI